MIVELTFTCSTVIIRGNMFDKRTSVKKPRNSKTCPTVYV